MSSTSSSVLAAVLAILLLFTILIEQTQAFGLPPSALAVAFEIELEAAKEEAAENFVREAAATSPMRQAMRLVAALCFLAALGIVTRKMAKQVLDPDNKVLPISKWFGLADQAGKAL
eukprot:CAMPEP_0194762726 /NCGR_PEP_ID=MMETSP0323_2-20130528/16777_1 /TAXON_ID=2866 ORGANISM="Crypthecodinium cohnii, Strain Seligo" /NCGR_SAMPLE_ID=MMETSP0323_2 /ASSEMBLY_ACC=CAM_ASM_000346 /LENGTH=116 /DNA_ID=CAMNT_0039685751 /DNA_START=146 /DNA_END=496 /DNA_ORIENTATION=-